MKFLVLTAALALASCSSSAPEIPASEVPLAGARDGAKAKGKAKRGRGKSKAKAEQAEGTDEIPGEVDGPKTVVFIVLDTVRSESMSMCGYDRNTTPGLDKLVENKGAVAVCRAYSPAPWTLPSHASYFTGLTVPGHGADLKGRPLSEEPPTLAEIMAEKGYQTALVSANAVLKEPSGLLRGFDKTRVSGPGDKLGGKKTPLAVRQVISELDSSKPLFLFVNIFDAHDPYPPVPADHDFLPEQEEISLHAHEKDDENPYFRFIKGTMDEEEAAEYVGGVRNGYDYGITIADRNYVRVMKHLEEGGWLEDGFRLVITSDHGEFIGEHNLLRHGGFVHEPVTKVPFVYLDTTLDTQPTLPEPLSAMAAFWLVKDGEIPDDMVHPHSVSTANPNNVKGGSNAAAVWGASADKLVWTDGDEQYFDLATDPGELDPKPMVTEHDRLEDYKALVRDHEQHLKREDGASDELTLQLQAMGYVENEE